jgi:hypothetical protein
MEDLKFSVCPNDISDVLTSAMGTSVNPSLDIYDFAMDSLATAQTNQNAPLYWIEQDANGNPHLCFYGDFGVQKEFVFIDGNSNQYKVYATEFVGGRPPVKPR